MHMSRDEFDRLVTEALDSIPEEFQERLENIYVTVEDEPGPEDSANLSPGSMLLGLYHGVPLTERHSYLPAMPDRITLYQQPIEIVGRTREGIVRQIRQTVIHEIAHYFGISDVRLRELGY